MCRLIAGLVTSRRSPCFLSFSFFLLNWWMATKSHKFVLGCWKRRFAVCDEYIGYWSKRISCVCFNTITFFNVEFAWIKMFFSQEFILEIINEQNMLFNRKKCIIFVLSRDRYPLLSFVFFSFSKLNFAKQIFFSLKQKRQL